MAENLGTLLEMIALCETERRVSLVGKALAWHRHQHGQLPNELAELDPRALAVPVDDPCTGDSLRLRHAPDGEVIVYGLGPDGRDDRGDGYGGTGFVPTFQGDVPFALVGER